MAAIKIIVEDRVAVNRLAACQVPGGRRRMQPLCP